MLLKSLRTVVLPPIIRRRSSAISPCSLNKILRLTSCGFLRFLLVCGVFKRRCSERPTPAGFLRHSGGTAVAFGHFERGKLQR